ncbi:mannose-1-phosphate guanylyltransferase/mannose-6-phosphate isomerase [Marinomonas mediterranea]|jgi:mannose-1-phosphate guanylyltransferase (GDP) (EC 2.7.7.22)/mannose-6-phosphate isomerase, type 2 (EC 5.3.1.8)|uniref:mannose-1-phosphate guanylyltransferase n=1 Tax=Marinomonas mediterranea (strain ATCC 700492 / JCM 21426 / NBRC 103028 / MMB-1) TaxID=717774 RepID=F2K173_MARM1|nr:mannose-1-phosphate guanylyltransferase/mannose-6-phosphate isomerase [Marinomonas mediterranea]ADZ89923.1 mannose-1-phosphate guanylyltransferase/mannose-6-phosphate isomerase [Marinomonas mediterranea MMB-1]WCN08007.1 mannose-1-phosphate guanylyltransferase/mannose-6-phosphate isomerase [Marinomonas mediterranea]WCN12102.1 mannose-1-phosphate guanylyltransferase/mannose-6-phosphate isomerase [Marinomonas mediterranea]WCN16139.1 mannose-1-phosphate guanylyltransferase/mannose-6-phosphate is
MHIVPVILSGGVGSRLWPLSREHFPKQCLNLTHDHLSLLQQTALRTQHLDVSMPIIVCNEDHRFLIAQQLQELNIKDARIILEPVGRNTAPAITLAALEATSDDSILLVLPADHVINNTAAFEEAITQAASLAKENYLVTFGIQPTRPETGYGYIKAGQNFDVETFVEKPDANTAEGYLTSGEYLWNSGMFLFKAGAFLAELKSQREDIYRAVSSAYQNKSEDLDFIRVDTEIFSACPEESIDYAVMEQTTKAKVVPYSGDWSDIGAWDALYDFAEKDKNLNVLIGDVMTEDTNNTLINAKSRLVAAVGVTNLAIIETADAVLVIDKDNAQNVKKIVKRIQKEGRNEHAFHTKVHRPWGTYQTVDLGSRHQVKRIIVMPGEKLSVQMHHHRAEHWVVVSGTAKVQNGEKEILLTENESTYIPIGEIHALENPGKIPLELIEVQSGSYLGEDDIVRYCDIYGR